MRAIFPRVHKFCINLCRQSAITCSLLERQKELKRDVKKKSTNLKRGSSTINWKVNIIGFLLYGDTLCAYTRHGNYINNNSETQLLGKVNHLPVHRQSLLSLPLTIFAYSIETNDHAWAVKGFQTLAMLSEGRTQNVINEIMHLSTFSIQFSSRIIFEPKIKMGGGEKKFIIISRIHCLYLQRKNF